MMFHREEKIYIDRTALDKQSDTHLRVTIARADVECHDAARLLLKRVEDTYRAGGCFDRRELIQKIRTVETYAEKLCNDHDKLLEKAFDLHLMILGGRPN